MGWGPPPPGHAPGTPAWVWVLVAVLAGLAVASLVAIAALGREATTRFEPVGTQVGDDGQSTFGGHDRGDNPVLDELWGRCAAGDGEACDDLFWSSEAGSEYERFGTTCGDRYRRSEVPYSCADALEDAPPSRPR